MNHTFSIEYTLGRDAEYSYIYREDESGNVIFDNRAVITVIDSANRTVYTVKENQDILSENTDGKAVISITASLPDGKYTVIFAKNGYTKTFTEFEISGSDAALSIVKPAKGDIKGSFGDKCGDGIIDIDDFIRVLRGFSTEASDMLRFSVDVNEDGVVNVNDLAIIKADMNR